MTAGASVTQLIDRLKEGDREAAQRLWERYFGRLVLETRRWLRHAPWQAADEEDVALSAFDSVCRRAEQGRFPRLFDRNDLWQLLVVIAFRKTCNQIKHEGRQRPRNGQVYEASALSTTDAENVGSIFSHLTGREPDPALAFQVAMSCRRLLKMLPTPELRDVAVWKLEGYTNEEIAAKMNGGEGRAVSTVERKLARIRKVWAKEIRS